MDFAPLIARKAERFRELEAEIGSANLYDDPRKARETLREHTRLKELLGNWELLEKTRTQLAENEELSKGDDPEMAELAAAELPALQARIAETERAIQFALLPPDPNEDRDAIIELRAGTGGSEAALFAADLYRMYSRYAESKGLKLETLESSPSELGGLKEMIFRLSGSAVFRQLRY